MINRVKEYRNKINITQQKLSNNIDISLSQLQNIEQSRSIPSIYIALKIAKELNCLVDDLFSLDE